MLKNRENNWGFDWNIHSLRRRFWNGQQQAHAAVSQAIKKGLLEPVTKFVCADCDEDATDYDHRDYSKPLEVDPVCRSCNLRRGRATPKRWVPEEAAAFTRQQVIRSCDWRMAVTPDLTVKEYKEEHIHHWVIARRTALAHWIASRQAFRLRDMAHELYSEHEEYRWEACSTDEILEVNKWLLIPPGGTLRDLKKAA